MSKQWHVVRAPCATRLKSVAKEYAAQGKIYVVWEIDNVSPYWVSQSLPTLLEAMNKFTCAPKRLCASSCYRITRGECTHGLHKFHQIKVFARNEEGIAQLNEHFQKARSIVFVTKTPERWKIHGEAQGGSGETTVAEKTPAGEHDRG